METLRKISIGLVSLLLTLSLFFGLTTFAITSYLGTSENIKQTISQSGLYENLVRIIIDNIKNDQQNQQSNELPLENPAVKAALEKALPPEFIQSSTEQAIDGVYGWLNDDSEKIAFVIDLKQSKTIFINSIADYAEQRAKTLPTCTSTEQIGDPNDLLNIGCLPPNFDTKAAKQQFINEAKNNDIFGKSSVINANNLTDQNKTPLEEQLSAVKQSYSLSKMLPTILAITALVLSVAILLLQSNRAKAMNILKNIYLSVGISVLIFSGIAWLSFRQVSPPSITLSDGASNPELQQGVTAAVTSIFDKIIEIFVVGGIVYVIIGIVCWLISKKLSPPLSKEQKQNNINNVLRSKELSDDNAAPLEVQADNNKEQSNSPADLPKTPDSNGHK